MVARTALHLCSGYGGFELALKRFGYRTVCHVERDAYAAATLVARMEEQALDQAPIWDDLSTFDGGPWRGKVDLITAGLPCQPFSAAGNQKGLTDPRHLWPHARRIISAVRPRIVFLENVPDVVRAGWLAGVLADLASLGFDAEWGMLGAANVGAPHRRKRFWLVGHANGTRRPEITGSTFGDETANGTCRTDSVDGASQGVADTDGIGCERPAPSRCCGWPDGDVGGPCSVGSCRQVVADTPRVGRVSGDGPGTAGEARWPITVAGHQWPPGPDEAERWADWAGPQPAIRRGTDGAPEWLADALHLGGNGLVPQCASEAFRQLCQRFER